MLPRDQSALRSLPMQGGVSCWLEVSGYVRRGGDGPFSGASSVVWREARAQGAVGAGTGAFTLPVAARARTVTALDYSPAMLRVLTRKLQENPGIDNVTPLLRRWEDAENVEPHDVVLAANALYRMADLRPALSKLICAARRRGMIVWSVGRRTAAQRMDQERTQPA